MLVCYFYHTSGVTEKKLDEQANRNFYLSTKPQGLDFIHVRTSVNRILLMVVITESMTDYTM